MGRRGGGGGSRGGQRSFSNASKVIRSTHSSSFSSAFKARRNTIAPSQSTNKFKSTRTNTRNKTTHYTYQANLKGGKKYIGRTTNPSRRFAQHRNGTGAICMKRYKPTSFLNVQKHSSLQQAKRAETARYYKTKEAHGANKVRGAGNTKPFRPLSSPSSRMKSFAMGTMRNSLLGL